MLMILGTVITINEDLYPHKRQDSLDRLEREILLDTRRNMINVFRSLSHVEQSASESPLTLLPIRQALGHSEEDAIDQATDAPGVLFYYLFENWFNSYSLVTRRESRYGIELVKIVSNAHLSYSVPCVQSGLADSTFRTAQSNVQKASPRNHRPPRPTQQPTARPAAALHWPYPPHLPRHLFPAHRHLSHHQRRDQRASPAPSRHEPPNAPKPDPSLPRPLPPPLRHANPLRALRNNNAFLPSDIPGDNKLQPHSHGRIRPHGSADARLAPDRQSDSLVPARQSHDGLLWAAAAWRWPVWRA